MKVIICEDDAIHRQFIQEEIEKYITFHQPSIEIVLSASNAEAVLVYLKNNQADCYFLDIELESPLTGMDLASEIRKRDPLASIIFVTTHADRLRLTFTYKLAALDFIVKDEHSKLAEQLRSSLVAAFQRYQQLGNTVEVGFYPIKIGERIKNIPLEDIYFFASSSQAHKIELHEKNGYYEFYSQLKLLEDLDERFYRCHKSYIINLQHIKEIDKKQRTVTMINEEVCLVSFRAMRTLQTKMLVWN